MMPTKGQHVKCVLRTGAMAEGIVEEWNINAAFAGGKFISNVQLRSLDGESILIIPHPDEDIMLIKIVLEKPKSEPKILTKQKETSLEKEFQEVYDQPSDDDLRVKKMADLKILLAEQDKKIIADKLKDHRIGDARKVEYGSPQFYKKPSA
jgi:hypothetical protein